MTRKKSGVNKVPSSSLPSSLLLSDATDGSLLHSYERVDVLTHLFGACLYAGKRKMLVSLPLRRRLNLSLCNCIQDVTLTFNNEADADKFARTVFSRYVGGTDDAHTWMYPTKCGLLQKVFLPVLVAQM